MTIDKPPPLLYTEDELERVAQMAAKIVLQQVLPSDVNLDSRITQDGIRSSFEEGESSMSSTYRESYSYLDEHGNTQTIRFGGKNKRETDAKFQEFLCGPKKEAPTLRSYVDTTYRKSYIDHLAATTKSNYERYLNSYIFPYMGDMKMNEKMYRNAFKRLGIAEYNNHDWRTTFGTQLKEAGMTSAQVADVMGHADTRMVETVYAPRRHEGIMKHKNTLEQLNQAYARGTAVAPKTAV